MIRYIGIRLINILLTLLIIASATFFLMKQLPGSPLNEQKLSQLPEDVREQVYEKYGLNKPLMIQYVTYLGDLAQGDLGDSFYYKGKSINKILYQRIGPSLLIGVQAVILGVVLGLILGMIAAFKQNTGWDYSTMFFAVLGVSIPNFVFAALLQYFVGLKWGILPIAYWQSYASSILPTIALSLTVVALIARFMRNQMIEVFQQDYMTTARAKGLSELSIIVKHGIRNALIPVLTILGPVAVSLITGSLVIEKIFAIPGIGALFVESIKVNDYTMIMGVTLLFSSFFVLFMLIIDILYSVIDPRIRISATKE